MAHAESDERSRLRRRALAALVLFAAIALPGVANYYLAGMGLNHLGSAVWVVGYGAGVFVLWYFWIRRIDLSGGS